MLNSISGHQRSRGAHLAGNQNTLNLKSEYGGKGIQWRIYGSATKAIIDADIVLAPGWHQAIIWRKRVMDYYQIYL